MEKFHNIPVKFKLMTYTYCIYISNRLILTPFKFLTKSNFIALQTTVNNFPQIMVFQIPD